MGAAFSGMAIHEWLGNRLWRGNHHALAAALAMDRRSDKRFFSKTQWSRESTTFSNALLFIDITLVISVA